MPLTTITTTICDGCGQEITADQTALTMKDDTNNLIYLHEFACLHPYADRKVGELAEKTQAAEAQITPVNPEGSL